MIPDYLLGQTLDFKFTTRAFATGIPTVLAGTPVVDIYEDNSLVQITAAETLTVSFDGIVGYNNLRVVATGGNGFETNKSYSAVLSAGTVGGVSVVGEQVAQFTIERSPGFGAVRPTVAGRTLDLTAAGLVDLGLWLGVAPSALTSGRVDGNLVSWTGQVPNALAGGNVQSSVQSMGPNALNGPAIDASAVTKLSQGNGELFAGVADSGSGTTLVDATLTEIDDEWVGCAIWFTSGNKDRKTRIITAFDAATDTITFTPGITPVVAASDAFTIWRQAPVDVQSWRGLDAALDIAGFLSAGGSVPAELILARVNSIPANSFSTGAIDAAALNADAITKIADGVLPEANVALNNIPVLLVAASDGRTPVTGATGTAVTRSIDGAAFGAITGTFAEIADGMYQLDASAADMNGGSIIFRVVGTGGTPGAPDDKFIFVRTRTGV